MYIARVSEYGIENLESSNNSEMELGSIVSMNSSPQHGGLKMKRNATSYSVIVTTYFIVPLLTRYKLFHWGRQINHFEQKILRQ